MSILEISEDKAVLIYITLILLKCSLKEVNIFYKCNKYYNNLNVDTFYIVDIVHTSGADENSKKYLAEMNTCYQDLVTAAKEVEDTFEEIDMYMLNTQSQKKVEQFLSKCSNVVKCDKMLMKATRSVFSKVHIQKTRQENTDNIKQKGHLCETCSKFFDSLYKLKEHHCTKKWMCATCQQNMFSQYNLHLHNQKECTKYTCKKCFEWFYNSRNFRQHKEDCNTVICNICEKECKDLKERSKHRRKEHP